MGTRLLLITCLAVVAGACTNPVSAPKLAQLPDDAQTEITVAGARLTLNTYLWRDFMPMAPADGRPLAVNLRVRDANGAALPRGLQISQAAVYFNGESWQSVPVVIPSNDPALLEATSSGGPKWGPGVSVDVVVELAVNGDHVLLRAADQPINRTD